MTWVLIAAGMVAGSFLSPEACDMAANLAAGNIYNQIERWHGGKALRQTENGSWVVILDGREVYGARCEEKK